MNKKNCSDTLRELISAELHHTEALMQILKDEKDTLPSESEQLLAISKNKQRELEALEKYSLKRIALIQSLGYAPSHDGMEFCINWCDPHKKLLNLWHQFIGKVSECRLLNQVNGGILDNNLRMIKQALSILHGQQPGSTNTYDAKGQEQQASMGHSIAKA